MNKIAGIPVDLADLKTCAKTNNRSSSGRITFGRVFGYLAIASLIFAFVYGFMLQRADTSTLLQPFLEGKEIKLVNDKPMVFEVIQDNQLMGYCGVSREQGYGGPLLVATEMDLDGNILNIFTLDNKETPSFYKKLVDKYFFNQFDGMPVKTQFLQDGEVDMISGATISCVAFTEGIEKVAHFSGNQYLGFNIPEYKIPWKFGYQEAGLIILFVFAFIAIYTKKKILTSISLGISFIYLGFWLNASLSVSSFGGILLGYFPDVRTHLLWWILVSVSIGSAVFLKKNVYCGYMCPFHAAQKGLISISGMKFRLPREVQKIAKHTSKFLLWASLMLIFLSANPTVSAYEPFAMLFSLEGVGIQWYILPATLIGSLFINDFFCTYFCPVGRSFTYLIKARKSIDGVVHKLKKA